MDKKVFEFVIPVADGTAKLSGRDYEFREELPGERRESQPTEPTDDAEHRANFWSIQGDFIFRHHNEPRVQLFVPKDATFPIPWKYFDVARSTHTDLDVVQEKRVDDYWNVDSNGRLTDSWSCFTKFTPLKSKPLKGYMWSRVRLTKVPTTTRPGHVWPEVLTKTGKAAQSREKLERKNEKSKLDNARRLRRIYFMDPDDQDHKETLKHARRKLERLMAAAMPCKEKARTGNTKVAAEVIASRNVPETIWKSGIPWNHKTTSGTFPTYKTRRSHCSEKVFTSMTHYNMVHKFIPVPQAMKIPDAKGGMEEARDNPSVANGECQEQKGGYSRSTKRQKESPLCYTDGHVSSQECGVGTEITNIQRQSRAPGGHDMGRLWGLRSLHWTGLVCVLDDCCKKKKRTLFQDCQVVMDKQLMQYSRCTRRSNWRMLQHCPDVWIRLPRHKWPKSWG